MTSVGAGVFWPLNTDPEFHPSRGVSVPSSDHRLSSLDLKGRRL
jgi:hypothetical protein